MTQLASKRVLIALLSSGAMACGSDGSGSSDAGLQPSPDGAAATIDGGGGGGADADVAVADAAVFDAGGGGTLDAGPQVTGVVLNEVLLDHVGASDTDEFAELKGEANTDYSGLSLLQIDGDNAANGTNAGLVLTVHAGCTTDASGYCEINVNANQFQNGTQSLLLVTGDAAFMGVDIDVDDDGVIDNEPWDQLVDAVAIFDGTPAVDNIDRTYSGTVVLNKSRENDEPVAFGGASRIPDGTDTDTADDWASNAPNFDNAGILTGEARNTPGAVNTVEP